MTVIYTDLFVSAKTHIISPISKITPPAAKPAMISETKNAVIFFYLKMKIKCLVNERIFLYSRNTDIRSYT